MIKFRDYIYRDDERIDSYVKQIKELNKTEKTEDYEREASMSGEVDVFVANGESIIKEKTLKSFSLDSSDLEKLVNWVYNDKNAINYEGEKLDSSDNGKLVVITGKMSIPQMSQQIEILNGLAGNTGLFQTVQLSDDDKEKLSYIRESDNMPILLELDSEYLFSCNLKKRCILNGCDDFLEQIDDDISVVGRIDKVYNSNDDIEIYDLIKEIFKLNRAIRRQIPKENLENTVITEKGPVVKITPLVIFK